MADKDVTMRLGTELKTAGADALKQIGSAAKDAAEQEKRHKDLLKESVASLLSVATAKDKILKSTQGIMAGTKEEIRAEREYQALLSKRLQQLETAKRLQRDMAAATGAGGASLGGSMGQASGAMGLGNLSAVAGVIAAVDRLARLGTVRPEHFDQGQFSSTLYRRSMMQGGADLLSMVPIAGAQLSAAAHAHNAMSPEFEGLRRIEEGKRMLGQMRQQVGLESGHALTMGGLGRELGTQQALARFGMTSAGQGAEVGMGGQALISLFQQQGAGKAGYDRHQALADFAQTTGAAVAREQQRLEATRQMSIIGAERGTAAGQMRAAAARLATERGGLAAAQRGVEAPGLSGEQLAERKLQLEQQIERVRAAQKVYDDAALHSKQLEVQLGQTMAQQTEQRVALLGQEHTRLSSVVREEKEREIHRRESFGVIHPMQQRTALGIAKKLSQGRQLSQPEIRFAQGMPDLFGQRLQKMGMEKTGEGSIYEQLRGLLPELGLRGKEAEKGLANIQQQFEVQIQLNEQALADQVQRKIIPEVQKAIEAAKAAFQNEMLNFRNQQWLQNRAAAAGGGGG